MRVLVVLNWLMRGGIEVMLLRAIPTLKQRGIFLDFCCLGGPGQLDDQFRSLGCETFQFPRRRQLARGHAEVSEILRRHQHDVVHSQFGFTSGAIARAAAERGVPVAVSIHSTIGPGDRVAGIPGLSQLRRAWLEWHRRLTMRHANLILGHSEANLDTAHPKWQEEGSPRYRVLLNGIPMPKSLPDRDASRAALGITSDEACLLHVGSFRRAKNHQGLLEIFSRVHRVNPDTKLILVGGGDMTPVREQVASHGLTDRVTFAGVCDDVWRYYAAADAFVFPSLYEGFGNALVEAEAAGIPLVASNIAPHREAVAPIQHRFLFNLPNYERAAQLVLDQLSANEKEPSAWVRESQSHVRNRFSMDRFADELHSIYASLTNQPSGTANRDGIAA